MLAIDRVLETVLYVDDLDAAERFYGDMLGLPLDSSKPDVFRFYRVGDGMLLLFEPEAASRNRGIPTHGATGPGHACFAVAEHDLEQWQRRLSEHGVAIEHTESWPRGGRSFYVRDPSGNSIEFATPRIWGMEDIGAGRAGV